jgi:hypothetical protein
MVEEAGPDRARAGTHPRGSPVTGFHLLATEDISWRIAPSVLHLPRGTLVFLAREVLLRRRGLSKVRWRHVLACRIAPWIGLGRRLLRLLPDHGGQALTMS